MENHYQSYQEMVIKVNGGLEKMEQISRQLNLAEKESALRSSRKKMASHKFSVGILGEFKRGKSTVINSLLEAEIVPADVVPTTATMNRITYDLTPHAEVLMKNGSIKTIGVDELKSFVTKLDETCEATAADVEEAIVYYPCKFCQNGVDIIDTPGLNDDARMNKVTEEVIPKLDAVILVVAAGAPFSMSEAEFVRNKIMASDLGKIIFLVNRMDMIRKEADKQKILNEVKKKISTSVLEKMEEIYGTDSREYQDAEMKLGSIQVYPFSALDALEGKMDGDEELIAKSGTREFESALTKMLTEDRGALELYSPLNLLASTVSEISNVVEARKNALTLSVEEFRRDQEQALEKIHDMRDQKRSEIAKLKNESKIACSELVSQVSSFYDELISKLDQEIENFPISADSVATEAGKSQAANALSETVYSKMEEQMSYLAERVQVNLQNRLNADIDRLGVIVLQRGEELSSAMMGDAQKNGNGDTTNFLKDIAIDVATDYIGVLGAGFPIIGIGGALAGYRAAGAKGLLVGGGVGAAASLLTLMVCPVVGIPAAIISCAAGTMAGKAVVKGAFRKDMMAKEIVKIRSNMRDSVHKYIEDCRKGRYLENWVNDTVLGRFEELIKTFEVECERMIKDTQATIDAIKRDLNTNEITRKQKNEELEQIITSIAELWKEMAPLQKKINASLREARI